MDNETLNQVLAALARIEQQQTALHVELVSRISRVEVKVDRTEIKVDRLHDDMHDVKVRLSGVETTVGSWISTTAAQSSRGDRFEMRLALIERRLELRDGHQGDPAS